MGGSFRFGVLAVARLGELRVGSHGVGDKRNAREGRERERCTARGSGVVESAQHGADAAVSRAGIAKLTDEVCRHLLQRLIDRHRATGDTFQNPAAQSQEVAVQLHDVVRVQQVFQNDRALGDELGTLLGAALGEKWDARFKDKARLVQEFRTLVQMHFIQGGGQLGGGGTRNCS